MATNYEERIAELKEKQKKLKAQEMKLRAQISADERKKRNKHLIETGKAVYALLDREYVDGDEERLVAFLTENQSEFLIAMERTTASNEAEPVADTEKVDTSSNFSDTPNDEATADPEPAEEPVKPKRRTRKSKTEKTGGDSDTAPKKRGRKAKAAQPETE